MRKKNIVTSLVLLAFCVYAWLEVKDLPLISNFFPKVCIGFLALLAILLLFQALMMKEVQEEKEKKNLKFVKILVANIALYIAAIITLGFNIGSVLFLGFSGYIFNPVKNNKSILYSFGLGIFVTVIFYIVFGVFFNVPLPKGIIIEALR